MEIFDIMDELDEMIYISNMETDELVYLNKKGKEILHLNQLDGQKCYKVLYGKSHPCKDCPKQSLDVGDFYIQNKESQRGDEEIVLKSKLIDWNGEKCSMCIQQVQEKQVNGKQKDNKGEDKQTKILVKESGQFLIEEYLNNIKDKNESFLLIIDLDNFNYINDAYSYIFGDVILEEVAEVLKNVISKEDIIARLGGDEFLLFLKNISKEQVYHVCKRIRSEVKKIYVGESSDISISCSIGMASTLLSAEFRTLFRYADNALSYVKRNKKGYALAYDDEADRIRSAGKSNIFGLHKISEIDTLEIDRTENSISFANALLERTKDLQSAINILISRLGKEFSFSRVTIFETNFEYYSNTVTYQWTAEAGTMKEKQVYYFEEKDFKELIKLYDVDGIFLLKSHTQKYQSEIINQALQYLSSKEKLFCAMYEKGNFKGSVIFEVEEENYPWTKETCDILKEVSKIISAYINKVNLENISRAKSEFLSRISHEIRTPMNAIMGMANIARNMLDDKVKMEDCLDKIDISTKYLLTVVNAILDITKLESGNIILTDEEIHLERIISELEINFKNQIKTNKINLKFKKMFQTRVLLGDSMHLLQVLSHLISNAINHAKEGGEIVVSITELLKEERDNKVKIRFSVKDNGVGIEKQKLTRIFQGLEQTEKAILEVYDGTGLGLAISNNMVRSMGGNINVISEDGVGSEFFFYLDYAIKEESTQTMQDVMEKVEVEEERNYDFTGKRLLIVEDNELNVEIAKTLLEMVGFEVEVAKNGKVAVDCFNTSEPGRYDAILMDIRMPVMDGLEATRRIRSSGKSDARTVSIVALSANAYDEDTRKSIANGMNGHLAKPIEVNHLYQVLQQLVM